MSIKINCVYTELVSVKDLIPHEKNPNKHTEEQIERLAKLFEYHGIRHPIIVSKLSGKIVAGHGRLDGAKKLGLETFPVDYQDFQDDESEYAFLVADNAINAWSDLDLSLVNYELPNLGPIDIDILGIKDFSIDLVDKKKDNKEKKPKECPSCGFEF